MKYVVLLLFCIPVFIMADNQSADNQNDILASAQPVILFKQRSFEIAELLKEKDLNNTFTVEQIALLESIITPAMVEKNTGRQIPNIGCDNERKEIYDPGQVQNPDYIVLTFSAKPTLQQTVDSLSKVRFVHNFIVDVDGQVYYAAFDATQSIEQALKHRPFALGTSNVVDKGMQIRDMNAHAISISVVGFDYYQATESAQKSLTELVGALRQKYSISPHKVLDYGMVAFDRQKGYGRRNPQPNLPWKMLAEHGHALWPNQQDFVDAHSLNLLLDEPALKVFWVAAALQKIGLAVPNTCDDQDLYLKNALIAFQKHFQCDNQQGDITDQTVNTLNSLIRQIHTLDDHAKKHSPPCLQDINGDISSNKKQN